MLKSHLFRSWFTKILCTGSPCVFLCVNSSALLILWAVLLFQAALSVEFSPFFLFLQFGCKLVHIARDTFHFDFTHAWWDFERNPDVGSVSGSLVCLGLIVCLWGSGSGSVIVLGSEHCHSYAVWSFIIDFNLIFNQSHNFLDNEQIWYEIKQLTCDWTFSALMGFTKF